MDRTGGIPVYLCGEWMSECGGEIRVSYEENQVMVVNTCL